MINNNFLRTEGYLYPVNILSIDTANEIKEQILTLYEKKSLFKYQSHLFYKWLYDLCYNKNLISVFKQVVGENPVLWNTAIFIKGPNDDAEMSPHQDTVYDGVISDSKYTVYLAITDNNQSSGSLYFYEKSHMLGDLEHIEYNINNMHGSKLAVNFDVSHLNKKFVSLLPGQASIHNMRTIHGSFKNYNNDYRISIGFRITNNLAEFVGDTHHGIIYEKSPKNLKNYKFIKNDEERFIFGKKDLNTFYSNFLMLKNITLSRD
jgi:ectoine hydroxylase-related dioxygenase (phytanoyl-CoA dioxygenase family)